MGQQPNQPSFDEVGFGNLISEKEAKQYIKNFKKIYQDQAGGKKLTRAIWFDRAVFEYIYNELQRDKGVDGIRIYLGAYDTAPGGVTTEHPNQISVFLVPTRPGIVPGSVNDWTFFQAPPTLILNHGRLCPPELNCTDGIDD